MQVLLKVVSLGSHCRVNIQPLPIGNQPKQFLKSDIFATYSLRHCTKLCCKEETEKKKN